MQTFNYDDAAEVELNEKDLRESNDTKVVQCIKCERFRFRNAFCIHCGMIYGKTEK